MDNAVASEIEDRPERYECFLFFFPLSCFFFFFFFQFLSSVCLSLSLALLLPLDGLLIFFRERLIPISVAKDPRAINGPRICFVRVRFTRDV